MKRRLFKSIVLLLAILITWGCKRNLQQKIFDHYNHYGKTGICTVSINDLTTFEWDKMYVFGSSANNEIISGTVNFAYRGNPIYAGFRRILFTWGRTKMYEEDYQPRSYRNSVIDFKIIDDSILNVRAYSFTQEEAFFMISREKIPGSCNNCFLYLLIRLENKNITIDSNSHKND
jgi:hypothetical protein